MESVEVILRELKYSDKANLAILANNRKIWDHVRNFFPHPYTEKDAEDFISKCSVEDPRVTFAIEYNMELTGIIGLVLQTDVYHFSAELGYWIGEPYWNKGIATQAVKKILNYGLRVLKLERIFTGVFAYNKASQRVLEKCGFELEGVFRKSVFKNNKFVDEFRYAAVNK